ncbi:hypothetical protein, conserved [Plasmodium gonderi]|uniref:Uncharacterized protein n=1 Tax=Plasmodium gonderi TaxID=77519 RepID=A0A1Y1JD29_PLAGO|nr:hypothetical protein, conserved [Plasmodium gonderi]GAW80396.1 hypothetical protein, conserved [Plasmodium gonderi]
MKERYLINNIVIKNFTTKRHSHCLYKKGDDGESWLMRLYKFSKCYKDLSNVEYYNNSKRSLYMGYTSDKGVKIRNIKRRIHKYKIMQNFKLTLFTCVSLFFVFCWIACLIVYNNKNHVECTISYTDCPIVLHKDISSFFNNSQINELKKEHVLKVYSAMKHIQMKMDISQAKAEEEKFRLIKKKKYTLLMTDKVKCTDCQVVYSIPKDETFDDIFNFEKANKCTKTVGTQHCVNVNDNENIIRNKRIHLYKRYTGHVRNTDMFENLKKQKRYIENAFKGFYMGEKIIIGDKIKYVYPFLNDYVCNLDYFFLHKSDGERIPVNEEPLGGWNFLLEKSEHICSSTYRKMFGKSTFYWLCPEFYEKKKNSREFKIAFMMKHMLNFEGAGPSEKNKHIIEMSKSSATVSRYNHFGYISNKLTFPFKIDIYNRFQPPDNEFLKQDLFEKIYKAFFCTHRGNSCAGKTNIDNKINYEQTGVLHKEVDVSKLASFFYPSYEDWGIASSGTGVEKLKEVDQLKSDEKLKEVDQLESDEKLKEVDQLESDEKLKEVDQLESDEKLKEVDQLESDEKLKEVDQLESDEKLKEVDQLKSDEKDYPFSHENVCETNCSVNERTLHVEDEKGGNVKRVLIEEVIMSKFRKSEKEEKLQNKFEKELIIVSSSIFFGIMKNMLRMVIFFLCILLVMILALVTFYVLINRGTDTSIILKNQYDMEEMPTYLKRISKHILRNGIGNINKVVNADRAYFRSHRHISNPF